MLFDFAKYPGKDAIIDDTGLVVKYDDLVVFQNEIKNIVPERSLVFLLSRNVAGSMAGYCVFVSTNVVPAMFGADTHKDMMADLAETYQPDYFWLPEDMASDFPYEKVYSRFNYCLLKTGMKSYPMHRELGLLLTTSGSTGSPKLVRLSYKNIDGFEEIILNYCEDYEYNRHTSTMPIYHNYDLLGLSRMLYHGWACLLTGKNFLNPDFWTFFTENGGDSFGSVPFNYDLLERIKFREKGIKLLYSSCGGGSLTPEVHNKYATWHKENGSTFMIIYGATEAPGGLLVLYGEDTLKKPGSIGKPVPPGEVTLEDDDGNVITQPNVPGEIVYTGPIVCMGYAQCGDDLIKDDEYNDVLHTGDIAYFDEEGFYFIVGRKARFLKLLGERVSLDETEQLLTGELKGSEVACKGVDDKLAVYVTDADEEIKQKIIMFLISRLKISPTLVVVKAVDSIPRLATGKIDYSKLA